MKQAGFDIDEILAATGAKQTGASARGVVRAISTDTRDFAARSTDAGGQLFVAIEGERFDGHAFLGDAAEAGALGAIVRRDHPAHKGFPPALPRFEVADTLRAFGDLAHFHRARFPALPVVAITGSNGKTTTRALCEAALTATLGAGHATAGNFNNLVGLPRTLLALQRGQAFCVLELGMNAPGEIARLTEIASPTVGLVTNAAGVHLEGLGSIEGVARAKAELYSGLAAGTVAIANADDPLLPALAMTQAKARGLRLLTFGKAQGADLRLRSVELSAKGLAARVEVPGGEALDFELGLLGAHNALNACAALTVACALGADLEVAAAALQAVRPVGRRLRQTTTTTGALLLDDCYNANLVSMGAALETASTLAANRGGKLFAALGDMLELGAHSAAHHQALGELVSRLGVAGLVGFGPEARATVEAATGLATADRLATEDPIVAAQYLACAGPADVVLIKGSRGMRMERIVASVEFPEAPGEQGGTGA